MASVVGVVGSLRIRVRILVHLRTSSIVTVGGVSDGLAVWVLRVGWVGRRDVLGRRRGVGRCHCCRDRRRVGRVLDQIYFGGTIGIPKVDREDIIGCIDLTIQVVSNLLYIAPILAWVSILDVNLLPSLLILHD